MPRVAVSSSSQIAADAGARIADEGGNAVDAAVGAVLTSTVVEPGICSLGGGAFVTIRSPDGKALTVDGYVEMPGRELPSDRFGRGRREVSLGYGGGVETTVGYGTIATPGALAALGRAWELHGRLAWAGLVAPARDWAREGFPLSKTARFYLGFSGDSIFGWHPEGRKALYHPDGTLLDQGEVVRTPGLADTLDRIAEHGAAEFYEGRTAELICDEIGANDGILTLEDLKEYRAIEREPLRLPFGGWEIATNPPPAIGGATLAAMLILMGSRPRAEWNREEAEHLARVQEAVFDYRAEHLDRAEDPWRAITHLLGPEGLAHLRRRSGPPSTAHTSAVDEDGLACGVTISSGYGSGVMPIGTGIWLNNCLGERELNRKGFHVDSPGTRLSSNMAPTVATGPGGSTLAIGSPGADRITSAILQVLLNFVNGGMELGEAIAYPRLHLERAGNGFRVAHEPGHPIEHVDSVPRRAFEELDMYFGGVGAALHDPDKGLSPAADPRREGGVAVGGSRE